MVIGIANCVVKTFYNAVTAIFALFIYRDKSHLHVFHISALMPSYYFFHRFFARFFGVHALRHIFNHQMRSAYFYYLLAQTGGCSCAHFIIHKQTRANNRGVAYPAPYLKCHAAGSATATYIAVCIKRHHANGIMVKSAVW